MNVVLDTNVIVSALLNTNGTPAKILAWALNGKVTVLYDNRVIFEYIEVLSRKEFGFDPETIADVINYFRTEGEFVNSEHINSKFIDETDKKFYEVYKSGGAQYLITGNIKHFPQEDGVLAPKDFLELFEG